MKRAPMLRAAVASCVPAAVLAAVASAQQLSGAAPAGGSGRQTAEPVGTAPAPAAATEQTSAAGAAGPAGVVENIREFIYKKTPQGDLKMFVHLPPEWKPADRRPAIVFFFGGGWRSGTTEQFRPQASYFASRGLVAARADYRVRSRHGTTPRECVEDAKSAVRWLRQKAADLGVDPERIIASGGSAGGHIAACTALVDGLDAKDEDAAVSSRPCALVLFNPALDLTALSEEARGASLPAAKELARQISPILYVKSDTPPMILFYGTEDRFVAHGRAMLAKAKEIGNRVELFTAEGMPHGFFNRSPWTEITARQADLFLASLGYLTGEPTIGPPPGATQSLKQE